jgi:hypothetical protein
LLHYGAVAYVTVYRVSSRPGGVAVEVSGRLNARFWAIRSELEVIHAPTGAVLVAYPYNKPDDVLASVRVIWAPTGAPVDTELAERIQFMGTQLLLEQARRATEARRVENVA